MKRWMLIFLTGGIAYPIIEVIWRGYSHYTMALAGGLSLVLISEVCCIRLKSKKMYLKCAAGSLIITVVEFAAGIVFNKILLMNVWNYSELPFNVLGQICLPFSIVWFFITIPAIYLCNKISGLLIDNKKQIGENPLDSPQN